MTVRSSPGILEKYKVQEYARNRGISLYTDALFEVKGLLKSCVTRSIHNLSVYCTFFSIHGFDFLKNQSGQSKVAPVGRSLMVTALLWVSLDFWNQMESYLKFHTAWLFAFYGNQEDKPVSAWPMAGQCFIGPFQKFIRRQLHKRGPTRPKTIQFFWSLLHAKRACAPLGVVSISKELDEYATLMSTSAEATPDVIATIVEVSKSIGIKAKKIGLKGFRIPAPSNKACYERSIANGGSKGYIREEILGRKEDNIRIGDIKKPDGSTKKGLICDEIAPRYLARVLIQPQEKFGSFKNEQPLFSGIEFIDNHEDYDRSEIREIFSVYENSYFPVGDVYIKFPVSAESPEASWSKIRMAAVKLNETKLSAKVVALPEPFKVRVLSKSHAVVNHFGKPLQKILHKILRNTDWCFPIGRPITIDDMSPFKSLESGWFIVSGDYKGATNYLPSNATVASISTVVSEMGLDPEIQKILVSSLSNHELEFDKVLEAFEEDPRYAQCKPPPNVTQQRGQLMGSILSFIILCILNVSAFLQTARLFWGNPKFSLRDCVEIHGLMINGDDILFKAPKAMIDLWYDIVKTFGLFPSVGKNYVSNEFFTINSMLFQRENIRDSVSDDWRVTQTEGDLHFTPFINLGLLFSTNPLVSSSDNAANPISFCQAASTIQEKLQLGHEQDEYIDWLFLRHNHKHLVEGSLGMNWFLPKSLGGLGLKTTHEVKVNPLQQRVATYIATRSTPEQVFRTKQALKPNRLPREAKIALDFVKLVGSHYGWEFGGYSTDNLFASLVQMDPYGYPCERNGEGTTEEILDFNRSLRNIFRKKLKKISNDLGSLTPMNVESMLTFDRLDPGFKYPVEINHSASRVDGYVMASH